MVGRYAPPMIKNKLVSEGLVLLLSAVGCVTIWVSITVIAARSF